MGDDLTRRARVVAVVQARMSSTRLPGKSLAKIGEHAALELLLRRLARAHELDDIVVATSTDTSDDPIEREARRLETGVVRGPLVDVLARFVQSCDARSADGVVRLTGDCPLTDPRVVDQAVLHWRSTGADYVSNTLEPRSYPDGFDVEVITASTLRETARLACRAADREHVTTYIRSHPEMFTVAELRLEPSFGDVRLTLDTMEDLRVLERLIADVGPDASMLEVLAALGFDSPVKVVQSP